MNIHFEIKNVPTRFICIDGLSFNYNEFVDVLEALYGTDYGFSHINIFDEKLANFLVEKNVASKTARGSYYSGDGFGDFYDMIMNAKW